MCRYDLDDLDVGWLTEYNTLMTSMGEQTLTEGEMEEILDEMETCCYENLQRAIRTVDGLGDCKSSLT